LALARSALTSTQPNAYVVSIDTQPRRPLLPEVKAFVIVHIAIHDWDGYRRYGLANHLEIFNKFSGKLVGADDDARVIEGSWPLTRAVVIESPSTELARAWYESDEYQAVVGLRHGSATSNLVFVSGYPG
jgi:uncharacterized protein (DUF1330 family)